MRKSKPVKFTAVDNHKGVSMILRLNESEHAWVKHIADTVELAQPKVVNLVLQEAIKHPPTAYIDRLKKEQKERQLRELMQEQTRLTEAIKKLETD